MDSPLFITVENMPIYHGDKYWAFTSDKKDRGILCTANRNTDYPDGVERFIYVQTITDAIQAYKLVNQLPLPPCQDLTSNPARRQSVSI